MSFEALEQQKEIMEDLRNIRKYYAELLARKKGLERLIPKVKASEVWQKIASAKEKKELDAIEAELFPKEEVTSGTET